MYIHAVTNTAQSRISGTRFRGYITEGDIGLQRVKFHVSARARARRPPPARAGKISKFFPIAELATVDGLRNARKV